MFIQPIAEANDVTAPDIEIVPAFAIAGPMIGIIADDRPDEEGINIVNNEVTRNTMITPTTAGTTLITEPNPSAIT